MTVRIGVIGAGVMGADHVNTLHRYVPSAEVVLVADTDTERARAAAATVPGARTADDARALIADSLTTLRAMDAIRRRCGIVFPGEAPGAGQPAGT
ncbi:Gfo/Idh/MocA family oxidoreductase [Streptomyces sp. NPDC093109]|uniref:Gfo/Idh/MocA family oxidoreductase n=1 Tax=Streptomyces sp. NPDC093109 TaxID=3154977 RepID=UPI00344BC372